MQLSDQELLIEAANARVTIYWLGDELASAPRGEDAIKTARFLITNVVAEHFAKI